MITKYELFEQKKQDWNLTLDLSKIWNEDIYENNNELINFNNQYINFINSNKNLIIKNTSENAWNKLEKIINRLSENKTKIVESSSAWDDIYDWGDSNLVEIKASQEIENNKNTDF